MWKLFSRRYSLSLSFSRIIVSFFSLSFFFFFAPFHANIHAYRGEPLTKIYTRRGYQNICKISKVGSSVFAGTVLVRFEADSRERGRRFPPWKYEPRISITKSFVFVATQVNDNLHHALRIECKPVLMHICSTLPFHNPTDLIYYHQRRPRTNDERRRKT